MSWLDRILRKESAVGRLMAASFLGRAVFPKRNFATFAKEAYQLNSVAYRCIELVSTSAASVPWLLYNEETEEEVPKHEILKLLRRPNPMQSGKELFTAAYAYDMLTGNTYIERVMVNGNSTIKELWAHRPDRMKVIPGRFGMPAAFEYSVSAEKKRFDCDLLTGEGDILHVKRFNPMDDWYGQSPLEALGMSVDSHNEATKWNFALLQNAGRPSGALEYEGELDDADFDRLKKELDEGYGRSRAGKPLLLKGGLKWVQMMLSQVDMDWLEGKKRSASEIAVGFKVPEQLVGVEGTQTYNNYREARMALYEDAVLPMLDRYAEALTNWMQNIKGMEGYCIKYDEDRIPALALRRENIWEKVGAAKFLTIDEKREALGYEPYDPAKDEGPGNVIFITASELPLTDTSMFNAIDSSAPEDPNAVDPNAPPVVDPTNPDAMQGALGAVPGGAPVQDLALNGAQIAAVVSIVQNVVDDLLPPESALQLLLVAFPSIDEATAHLLIDPAAAFEKPAPDPMMMPGVPPGTPGAAPANAKPKPAATPVEKRVMHALLQLGTKRRRAKFNKAYRLAYGGDPATADHSVRVSVHTPDVHVHAPSINVDARTSVDAGAVQVTSDVKAGDTHLITNGPDGDTITTYERDPDTKEIVSSTKSIKEKK